MANETEDIVQGTHYILVFSLALLLFGMPLLGIPLCNARARAHTHTSKPKPSNRSVQLPCVLGGSELLEI